jgi:hypothetical protein
MPTKNLKNRKGRCCMRVHTHLLAVLALLFVSGCSEPLDDTACDRNEDCEAGYACDSGGVCVAAAELQIVSQNLIDAFTGEAYTDTVRATGGIEDYTWSLSREDPGETRLDWIEIVADTGEIRNQPGEFPVDMGSELGLVITVRDGSNRGEGQEDSAVFKLDILECRGDQDCWEYGEDQGSWGCREGSRACVDGALGDQCVLSGWSTSTDHCGEGCGVCDEKVANSCVQGNCACGQTGGPCPAGETCCSGSCTDLKDLNHCGDCDKPCQPQNVVSASCDQGTCTYDQCDAGYYDCDTNTANGCETASGLDDCSGCNDTCTDQALYPNTTGQSCPAGVCVYQCVPDYADCNAGQPGCETALGTVQNCSDCEDDCSVSADGHVCIDDSGAWRCGCASAADCDGDDMCCTGICKPHDTEHCADCDTGCSVGTGGPECVKVSDGPPPVYECQCDPSPGSTDCQGRFDFSQAECLPSTRQCFCSSTDPVCDGTPDDMCCYVGTEKHCVNLNSHDENCGICGAICGKNEVDECNQDQSCSSGACTCSAVCSCPQDSGATLCTIEGVCVCGSYGAGDGPCPAGQYCCAAEGCCIQTCGTLNNECSTACIGAGDIWCDWGCCDTCQTEDDC